MVDSCKLHNLADWCNRLFQELYCVTNEQRERDKAAKNAVLLEIAPRLLLEMGQAFDRGLEHGLKSMIQKMEEDVAMGAGSNGGSGSRDIRR